MRWYAFSTALCNLESGRNARTGLSSAGIFRIAEIRLTIKIFYHVKNLSEANLKSKRVSKLIFDIVRPNKINPEDAILNNENYVWGELFITSSKNNPYPALEDIYSQCAVIKVKNLKTIQKINVHYVC